MTQDHEEKRKRKIDIENNMIANLPIAAMGFVFSAFLADSDEKLFLSLFGFCCILFFAGWLKSKVTGEKMFIWKRNSEKY